MNRPPFGLLLDVDGPISNPDAKAITQAAIIPLLVDLLARDIPIILNTGRSADFVRRQVFGPLEEVGIKDYRHLLFAVCEKGAVWFASEGKEMVDTSLATPPDVVEQVRRIIEADYADTTFFDTTKQAMVSTERRPDVAGATYLADQERLLEELPTSLRLLGYRVAVTGEPEIDAQLRVDPSIIATDVEDIRLGKALGAQRALEMVPDRQPQRWRTVGDSSTDYEMARWLNEQGHDVCHIDVSHTSSSQAHPFPVLHPTQTTLDCAGALYLEWLVRHLDGANTAEEAFDR